jgi:hypothetical protein
LSKEKLIVDDFVNVERIGVLLRFPV